MPLTKIRVLLAAALAVTAALTPATSNAQAGRGDLYTVANVSVRADADDAVEAKKIAISTAQAKAFHELLQRLVDFRLHARIPPIQPDDVERLVSNLDVRDEGFSGTRYQATFDVGFSERPVKALLNQFALPFSEERASGLLIVPVYVEDGAAQPGDRNVWRAALAGLDLKNAPVPLTLAPTRADITAEIAMAYVASPESALQTLQNQHRARNLMLAFAELGADGESIVLRLVGADSLGEFTLERKLRSKDSPEEALADFAAEVAFQTVQQRWKLTRASSSLAASGSVGALTPLELTAEFSGLKEWQAIRGKLQKLPGLQNFEVRSVNPRGALITLEYPGGGEQLAQVAGSQGLAVDSSTGAWTVRTR